MGVLEAIRTLFGLGLCDAIVHVISIIGKAVYAD